MTNYSFPLRSIWVVDDTELFCKHINETLKINRLADEVSVYYNCESALKSISCLSVFPEIVLLDIYFSGTCKTGIDALPYFKKIAPLTKIIILTAFEEELNASFALNLGASGFLVKLAQNCDIKEAIEVSLRLEYTFNRYSFPK